MIPRTIHQVWTGGPVPAHLAGYMGTWSELHPTWQVRVWTDDDPPPMTAAGRRMWDAAPDVFATAVGQFRADVARLELLAELGGVYVDCDLEARRPLDPLLPYDVDGFAAWEVDDRWVGNTVLGCVPGHPWFVQLRDGLEARVAARRPGWRPNRVTGPYYLTDRYRRCPERERPVVFPSRLFFPYLWNELDAGRRPFPDAYAVHHWHNARTRTRTPR